MTETRRLADTSWLAAEPLAGVLAMLDRDGEEARVIGGAVRNAMLGQPPGDIDIATTATPEEVTARAAAAGFKPVPTGFDHGTVTVVADSVPFEVTSLRADIETFGRKAKVAFGRDWRVDAERRDFTVNSLSVDPRGLVYDYVGGLDDIAARRLRFIGNPDQRIAEDYLRILRFFRFHAWYGHGLPDADGLRACLRARDGLRQLSRERVRMEVLKLLGAPHATATLASMAEAGLLHQVLGAVARLASFENLVKAEAAAGVAGDPVRRLGALAVWIAEDAERLWERLRLSNAEHERLASIAARWWALAPAMGEGAAKALIYRIGPARFLDRALVAWSRAMEGAHDAAWRDLASLPARWTAPKFPLKAADFIARGLARGPQLGAALAAAESAWIAAGFPDDPAELAALADHAASKPS